MNSTKVSNDLYDGVSEEIRAELAHYEKTVTIRRGTKMVEAGVLPDDLVILNAGTAETFVLVQGEQVSLGISGPGSVFGLLPVFSGEPPHTTVICREDSEVTLLPRNAFRLVLDRHPEMHSAVVKVLSVDLAIADHLLCETARDSTVRPGPRSSRHRKKQPRLLL